MSKKDTGLPLPKIENHPTDSQIKKAKDWLLKVHSGKKTNSNGMFIVVKDKTSQSEDNGACHASLNAFSRNNSIGDKPVLVGTLTHPLQFCNRKSYVSGPLKCAEFDNGAAERYMRWLITDSFAAPYSLNEDVEFALGVGTLWSADAPSNVLAGACMASRYARENYKRLFFWDWLVREKDCPPNLAFAIANTALSDNQVTAAPKTGDLEKDWGLKGAMSCYVGGHLVFDCMSLDMLLDSARLRYRSLNGSYRSGANYYGVAAMFGAFYQGNRSGVYWTKTLSQEWEKWRAGPVKAIEEEVSPVVNPFAIKKPDTNAPAMKWEEFFNEGGLDLLKEMV